MFLDYKHMWARRSRAEKIYRMISAWYRFYHITDEMDDTIVYECLYDLDMKLLTSGLPYNTRARIAECFGLYCFKTVDEKRKEVL